MKVWQIILTTIAVGLNAAIAGGLLLLMLDPVSAAVGGVAWGAMFALWVQLGLIDTAAAKLSGKK